MNLRCPSVFVCLFVCFSFVYQKIWEILVKWLMILAVLVRCLEYVPKETELIL